MEEREHMVAQLNTNDLYALVTILQFYERFLRETAAPSAKRSRQCIEIQFLMVKIYQVVDAKAMALTCAEVDLIIAALTSFISQVRAKIPCSKNRDDVLESSEQLRMYITTVFAPPNEHMNN